ncbi:MAG: hypothetical protein ACT4PY_07915 [Armatimonadota bacterium]
MQGQVIARFLVDRPIRPGMVRAILDTLAAQGGAYEPQLVRRSTDGSMRRIAGGRPAGLLDEVGEGGTQTTFLRVAEDRPHPVLSFSVSRTPRARPTAVLLTVPAAALGSSGEIDRLLGICKGLYLFLEATWGVVGIEEAPRRERVGEASAPAHLGWANFFGPEIVLRIGPARLLTSLAFIVEILPDGGMMLVTHPAPEIAMTTDGRGLRAQIERDLSLKSALRPIQASMAAP